MPTTTVEEPLSIKPPEKGEVPRGFTSTLFKMGEYGELLRGGEAQKTRQEDGRCVSLQHMAGLE